jgi:O-methyltransferase involved in polyketide biosynthesis
LDYDYSGVAGSYGEYGIIASATRAYQIDKILHAYISKYLDTTIVNLGAGLDTTLVRVDNGLINWYDLDLPEIIELRRSALGERERGVYIAKSIFDYSWMEEIAFEREKGVLFIAAGLFYYFRFAEIKDLVVKLAERFPGGELIFDSGSKTGVAISNRMVVKTGNSGAKMYFYVSNPKALGQRGQSHTSSNETGAITAGGDGQNRSLWEPVRDRTRTKSSFRMRYTSNQSGWTWHSRCPTHFPVSSWSRNFGGSSVREASNRMHSSIREISKLRFIASL